MSTVEELLGDVVRHDGAYLVRSVDEHLPLSVAELSAELDEARVGVVHDELAWTHVEVVVVRGEIVDVLLLVGLLVGQLDDFEEGFGFSVAEREPEPVFHDPRCPW